MGQLSGNFGKLPLMSVHDDALRDARSRCRRLPTTFEKLRRFLLAACHLQALPSQSFWERSTFSCCTAPVNTASPSGWVWKSEGAFSPQVCGARGAGGAAAQGVFLAIKPNEVYMLVRPSLSGSLHSCI